MITTISNVELGSSVYVSLLSEKRIVSYSTKYDTHLKCVLIGHFIPTDERCIAWSEDVAVIGARQIYNISNKRENKSSYIMTEDCKKYPHYMWVSGFTKVAVDDDCISISLL